MNIKGIRTFFLCIAMVSFGSSGLAAEPPDMLNNGNANNKEGQEKTGVIRGKVGKITGPTMIISDKELYLTPNTTFYDKYGNGIPLNGIKAGEEVQGVFDLQTLWLISVVKIPIYGKDTLSEKKPPKESGISTPPAKKDERPIQLRDGVYKN